MNSDGCEWLVALGKIMSKEAYRQKGTKDKIARYVDQQKYRDLVLIVVICSSNFF